MLVFLKLRPNDARYNVSSCVNLTLTLHNYFPFVLIERQEVQLSHCCPGLPSKAFGSKTSLSKIPWYSLFAPSKFYISVAFIFSWDHNKSQEKMETMLLQNFGGTNKEYYGIFWSDLCKPVRDRLEAHYSETAQKHWRRVLLTATNLLLTFVVFFERNFSIFILVHIQQSVSSFFKKTFFCCFMVPSS